MLCYGTVFDVYNIFTLCYGTVFDVYNIHMLSVEMQHIHIHNIYGPDYSIGTTFVCLFLV